MNKNNYNYHDDKCNYNCFDDNDLNFYDMSDRDYMFEVEEIQVDNNDYKDLNYESDNWDFSFCEDNDYSCKHKNNCYDNVKDTEYSECHWEDNFKCDYDCDCDDDSHNDCHDDCHDDCDDECNNDNNHCNKADLIVEKLVDKEVAFRGEVLSYCLTIKNIGTVSACNVVIKDCLDKCLCYVRGSLRINDRRINSCHWNDIAIREIRPSQCIKITFKAILRQCSSDVVENFAVVCYSYSPNSSADMVNEKTYSNTVATRVLPVEIDMVKSVNRQCVQLGDIIVYTIEINNRCNATLENFILRDQLNPALRCLEIMSRGQKYNCCRLSRGINLGQIAPHETVCVYIKARVEAMGQGCMISNVACGMYTLNGILGEEIQSNVCNISVRFNQCREVNLRDVVKLTCEMGPAIGIVQCRGKAEIKKVDRINGCGNQNRLRVVGCVKVQYVYDKGYNCHDKVCSEVPFKLIVRTPAGLNTTDNLDLNVCLKDICSKIKCGYTIISNLKLAVSLKSK